MFQIGVSSKYIKREKTIGGELLSAGKFAGEIAYIDISCYICLPASLPADFCEEN